MGLGILNDKHLENVPGTTLFSQDPNAVAESQYAGVELSALKHGKGRNSHIVLVPQPSDDPNDPLNWPRWKKHLTYGVLMYGTVLCGALGPLVAGAQVEMAQIFGVSLQAMSRALGTALVATLGIATLVWAPLATKYGKRPVYLLSTVFMLVGTIVASEAKTYGVLLGSRILQGVGQAVCEFLCGSTINDIYFVHERGWPIALFTIALLNGINVTPPISGQVFAHLGWRWCWRIFYIATILLLVLQIFFLPETTYNRRRVVAPSKATDEKLSDLDKPELDQLESGSSHMHKQKKSFLQEMSLYSGPFDKDRSFLQLAFEPVAALLSPAVLYAVCTYGLYITFLVVIATGSAQVYVGVYSFGAVGVGNTYLAPLVADFLAAALVGPLTDYLARRLSAANGGIFEPEFRLPVMLAFFICSGAGFIGFGLSIRNHLSYWAPIIFAGILNFGITIGCHGVIAYVVECHRHSSDAALGAVIFGKNALSAIFTSFTNIWLAKGVDLAFIEMGILCIGTSLFTVPMWIYGKRVRSLIARKLHIERAAATVVDS
ncbi:hypothetical protein NBRC10512_003280 [Rhodotorula toruloides]|uniref:Cycloheximide resistance protein, Mfs transporter n=1 Tax=Rhodotorula toruloides (strain NP11) TaxID=1130832 RepID=M7WNB7_RHOT1|nr:cycloheximide resistance protein, Mfs transporter [Rhodotorula toruloides NP11]EMS19320.1 cycloheximide resistance protein, Mfs transporter [Rhodotorula toruloides NP11]